MAVTTKPLPGLREVVAVGAICAILTAAMFATYARFPPEDLYHVTGTGLRGGASSALVFLNFPVAFIALAILPIAVAWLLPRSAGRTRWLVGLLAAVAAGLCLVATVSVEQSDLDAKPLNVLPALGVALTFALAGQSIRTVRAGTTQPWREIDSALAALGVTILLLGIPWLLAVFGVYAEDIPGLARIFMSKGIENGEEVAYVHLGGHHGFYGLLLAVCGLALSRVVGALRPHWLDRALSWYVSLMIVYGIANMYQDVWGEQVVKRGWSTHSVASLTRPEPDARWLVIALAIVAVRLMLFARTPVRRSHGGRRALVPSS